jgi:hypothetical protein
LFDPSRLREELSYGGKRQIDAGKAQVRDVIELEQLFHDKVSDPSHGHLSLGHFPERVFDAVNDGIERFRRDRALLTGATETHEDFVARERFASPISFNEEREHDLKALIGGEARFALQALSPPPNGVACLALATVDDLGVRLAAAWASHDGS